MKTLKKIIAGYKTDKNKESNGVERKYCNGNLAFTIGRAGGGNDKYFKAMQKEWKPVQRIADLGELSNEKATEVYWSVYAEAIIFGAKFLDDDGTWKVGLGYEDEASGYAVQATKENLVALFRDAPELFLEIRMDAENRELFLLQDAEDDAKN